MCFFRIFNALIFGLLGYVCEKLWLIKVEWGWVVCCKVGIAVVHVVQHVGSCAQVLQTLAVSI